jgi:hypothetical protein
MVLAVLAALFAADVRAIAPAKPSDVVDVELRLFAGDNCSLPVFGGKFDTRLQPNGSQAAFTIPPGRVLVVTAIELLGFGASPGTLVQTRIFRGAGSVANHVAIRESHADAGGRIFHIYEFDPGLVVASGGEVCTNHNLFDFTTVGYLRGFLAPP